MLPTAEFPQEGTWSSVVASESPSQKCNECILGYSTKEKRSSPAYQILVQQRPMYSSESIYELLADRVTDLLAQGWTCEGGIAVSMLGDGLVYQLTQAMSR